MKGKVIAVLVSSVLATSAVAGERGRAAKEESMGVGGGAAIGALAGGPVGLILGAAFGGWLGDRFHHERAERRLADERSQQANTRADSLSAQLASSEGVIAEKESALFEERVAHRRDLEQALSIEVYFRTEESALADDTAKRLGRLASLIEPIEGAVIHLEGHTDTRGTEEYNAELSTSRAYAVRDALVRGGLPANRILVTAAGEAESIAADADGMALERRVQMSVVGVDDASRVAQQSEE